MPYVPFDGENCHSSYRQRIWRFDDEGNPVYAIRGRTFVSSLAIAEELERYDRKARKIQKRMQQTG